MKKQYCGNVEVLDCQKKVHHKAYARKMPDLRPMMSAAADKHMLQKKTAPAMVRALTRGTLATGDIHHISRQGVDPLALLGVLAVITQVDGSVATLRQLSIVSCHNGATQNLQGLLVARHQHTHVVRVPHLPAWRAHTSVRLLRWHERE